MNIKRNYLIIILFLCAAFILLPDKIKASHKYYLHSLVKQTMTPEIEGVIKFWINFLYEENDSLRQTYWDKNEVARFGDNYCLFCTSFFYQYGRIATLDFLPPYILYVEKIDEQFLITTMFTEYSFTLSDSSLKNQSPWGIIKVIVEKHNNTLTLKNVLSNETLLWRRFQVGNIDYYIEPMVQIDTIACFEANKYVDSISNIWYGKNYDKKIDYYVASTSATINKLVGFDFGFLGGIGDGFTLINAKMILSGNKNFQYKHELTHLVLGEIPNQLLSEGLATYFGGTGNLDFNAAVKKFSRENYPLTDEKITNIFDYPGFFEFYVFSALLCEQVYKVKGIAGLQSLLKDTTHEVGEDFHNANNIMLQRICNLLGVSEPELFDRINNRLKF